MASYSEYLSNGYSLAEDVYIAMRKDMTMYMGCGHKYVPAGCVMHPGSFKEMVLRHVHIIDCENFARIDAFDPVLEALFETLS